MALTRRAITIVVVLLIGASALWWLRDPAWLGDYRHGFHGDGWTGGRASFFVPADHASVTFDVAGHDQFTMQVSVYLDGRSFFRRCQLAHGNRPHRSSRHLPAPSARGHPRGAHLGPRPEGDSSPHMIGPCVVLV